MMNPGMFNEGVAGTRIPSTSPLLTLTQVSKGEVDGILVPATPSLNIPGFIMETAHAQGIPTMFPGAFWVDQGLGLASYGADDSEWGRQIARLVDKILKGT